MGLLRRGQRESDRQSQAERFGETAVGNLLVAIIPAYNVDRLIGSAVLKAKSWADHVVVVDDNSTDETGTLAWEAGADVVSHRLRLGQVESIRTGFKRAFALQATHVIVLERFDQLESDHIPRIVQPLQGGKADIVVATISEELVKVVSRTADGDLVIRADNGAGVPVFSGSEAPFYAFTIGALRSLNGFSLGPELWPQAHEYGLRIVDISLSDKESSVRGGTAARSVTTDRAQVRKVRRAKQIEATIIIPAYNEEEALPHVLDEVMAIVDDSYEVIVVDDGSQDDTNVVAASYGCRVLSHPTNYGKGAAMKTGIRHARGEKVVFIDGDATYPVNAIPTIVRELDDHELVRAIRHDGRENIPRLNRFGNRMFEVLIHLAHHVDSADALTGLYGLHRGTLRKMQLEADGFDVESEIVIKVGALGLRTKSIQVPYFERIGEKKLRPVQDGLVILSRITALAVMRNPFLMYFVPGLVLWSVAALVVAASSGFLGFITGAQTVSALPLIVGAMGFLGGFQLMIFGFVANLYSAETGLTVPSRSLYYLARNFPRFKGAMASTLLIAIGVAAGAYVLLEWMGTPGADPTLLANSRLLVLSPVMIIWGIQLLCTMFFLSLFANLTKFKP